MIAVHLANCSKLQGHVWVCTSEQNDLKLTAAVGCPCTWHNELACCGGSQVGSSSLWCDRVQYDARYGGVMP